MPYTQSFKKLIGAVRSEYLGKPVSVRFQDKYGKRYDLKETKKIAFAIAKSKGLKIH